ncbi:MAG: hypothetical protein WC725_05110 [Patescibacteria group bacterium]|jgi:hypothetical protein
MGLIANFYRCKDKQQIGTELRENYFVDNFAKKLKNAKFDNCHVTARFEIDDILMLKNEIELWFEIQLTVTQVIYFKKLSKSKNFICYPNTRIFVYLMRRDALNIAKKMLLENTPMRYFSIH